MLLVVQEASGSHSEGMPWLACCALNFLLPPDLLPGIIISLGPSSLLPLLWGSGAQRPHQLFCLYSYISLSNPTSTCWIPTLCRPWMVGKGETHHERYSPGCRFFSIQFSSVSQSSPTLCDPMDCSTPGLPVHHQLPEFTQTHVH